MGERLVRTQKLFSSILITATNSRLQLRSAPDALTKASLAVPLTNIYPNQSLGNLDKFKIESIFFALCFVHRNLDLAIVANTEDILDLRVLHGCAYSDAYNEG